jgi:hypothetical protein
MRAPPSTPESIAQNDHFMAVKQILKIEFGDFMHTQDFEVYRRFFTATPEAVAARIIDARKQRK